METCLDRPHIWCSGWKWSEDMKDQLTEDTAKKIERISELVWSAMEELTKIKGHSTATLNLEGSVYDLKEIVKNAEIPR